MKNKKDLLRKVHDIKVSFSSMDEDERNIVKKLLSRIDSESCFGSPFTKNPTRAIHVLDSGLINESENKRSMLIDKIKSLRGMVNVVSQPDNVFDTLDEARQKFPNFTEVIDYIEDEAHLNKVCINSDFLIRTPILMNGPSGTGKTKFAEWLSDKMGVGYEKIDGSSSTQGWELSGMSESWKSAKPGLVIRSMFLKNCANPIFVMDEIDKIVDGGGHGNMIGALYSLFEKNTAKSFVDEFLQVPADASKISWFATSNDSSCIPSHILDRLTTFEIGRPDRQGMVNIVRNIWKEFKEEDFGGSYQDDLSSDALDLLVDVAEDQSIRQVKKILLRAVSIGSAHSDGVFHVGKDQVELAIGRRSPSSSTQKIGFVS